MSADNGIYIAKFNDGYRVAYAQAIENVEFNGRESEIARAHQQFLFGQSELYSTEDEAKDAAFEKEKEFLKGDEEDIFPPYLEYGICFLTGTFGEFPKYTQEELYNIMRGI